MLHNGVHGENEGVLPLKIGVVTRHVLREPFCSLKVEPDILDDLFTQGEHTVSRKCILPNEIGNFD